jgi:hypothetical protein
MRARRLKKHPVEEREAKILRELKRQKVVGVLEEAIKPVIIQALKAIPSHVSRTQLRKLEEEVLKKTRQKADVDYPFYRFDVERKRVFIKGKDGRFKPYPITEEIMKKFRKAMKDVESEIGKEDRKKLR